MKYQITNKKLNVILGELAEEYKDLLIETALSQTNEIDLDNINISDITKIDLKTKEQLKNRSRNYKNSKVSQLVSMIGWMYSVIGLMLILISTVESKIYNNALTSIAIVCIFIGLLVIILGMITKFVFRDREKIKINKMPLDYEIQIVNKWRIMESVIYQITPQNDSLSLRTIISNLEQSKIISKEDVKTIKILMYYRNIILHNAPGNLEYTDEIKKTLKESQKLIDKLSEIS